MALENHLRWAFAAPILGAAEENRLARTFRASADPAALERLVTSHLRLVAKIASQYRGHNLAFEDLVSEGCVGLLEAAKRFDPDKGFRFATYARWWIRSQIANFAVRTNSIVRARGRRRSGSARHEVAPAANYRDEGRSDLQLVVSARSAAQARPVAASSPRWTFGRDVSLSRPIEDASLTEVEDLLVDPTPNVEVELADRERSVINRRLLADAIDRLTDRERHIFAARHLLEKRCTLEQLSHTHSISRERVRQIDAIAWGKVRRAVRIGPIRPPQRLRKGPRTYLC